MKSALTNADRSLILLPVRLLWYRARLIWYALLFTPAEAAAAAAAADFVTPQQTSSHPSRLGHTPADFVTPQQTSSHPSSLRHTPAVFVTPQQTSSHPSRLRHTPADFVTPQQTSSHPSRLRHTPYQRRNNATVWFRNPGHGVPLTTHTACYGHCRQGCMPPPAKQGLQACTCSSSLKATHKVYCSKCMAPLLHMRRGLMPRVKAPAVQRTCHMSA
jgi:hypothetical protein